MPEVRLSGSAMPARVRPTLAASCRRGAGLWIRKLRLRKGYTQAEVEARAAMAQGSISRIESGQASIPPERYEVLAIVLGVDDEEFGLAMVRWSNPWLALMAFSQRLPSIEVERMKRELARAAKARRPRRRRTGRPVRP
ncbi:MAG: helix-turn-helix transcriptional regulator [Rhodospirillales bacterium]|nr:helix-turn-helix transcriptional regulator [Rhodospirillales bacterium]